MNENMNDITTTDTHSVTSKEKGTLLAPIAIAIALLAAAGAGYGFEHIRAIRAEISAIPTVKVKDNSDEIAALTAQNAVLEKDISDIRSELETLQSTLADMSVVAPTTDNTDTAASEKLANVSEELAEKLAKLTKARKVLSARISSVEGQLATPNEPESSANIRLAYQLLRTDVMAGNPYTDSLTQLRALVGDTEEYTAYFIPLERYQDSGIMTRGALYQALQSITLSGDIATRDEVTITPPQTNNTGDEGLWNRSKNELAKLVRIERIGEDTSPLDVLNEAQRMMALGDTKRTMDILRGLPQSDRERFGVWMDDANARLRALDALARLSKAVFTPAPTSTPATPSEP